MAKRRWISPLRRHATRRRCIFVKDENEFMAFPKMKGLGGKLRVVVDLRVVDEGSFHCPAAFFFPGCARHITLQPSSSEMLSLGFQRMRTYNQKLETFSKSWCGEKMERFTLTKPPKCCDLHETIECQRPDTIDASREGGPYHTWTMKHPSALKMFDQMMNGAKKKRIAVFLDYDGTLSPIVDEPDRAFMSDAMRSAVRDVAEHFPTAIISGRCRDKVYDFVQLQDVYYVGSHGMDIMVPSEHPNNCGNSDTKVSRWLGNEEVFQPAKDFLPKIEEIYRALDERTMEIRGVLIENNKFCLSVHFRRVNAEDWMILEEQVKDVLKDYPNFHLTWGRKVMEIRPCIKWDKGCALEYLLDTLGFGTDTDVLPFYLGDDRTDEDAFKVLERRGQGFPIIVSSIPRDTKASFSLRDPSEVMSFLLRLAKWGRNFSASNSF